MAYYIHPMTHVDTSTPSVVADTARILRDVLAELQPLTTQDRNIARKIETAALALEMVELSAPLGRRQPFSRRPKK